jgi:hypothetical protein
MSKYVLFLYSEASHPLPLNPVGTIFALNCWHYKFTRGCAWIHVGHSVCKLAGLKAHSDYQINPTKKVLLHGKTAYVGLHP